MNNPKSTALGWGSLVLAAGVSYYFAKVGVDERRAKQDVEGTRPSEKLDWKQRIERDMQAQAETAQAQEKARNSGAPAQSVQRSNEDIPEHPK